MMDKTMKTDSGVEIITTKEAYIRYILSKSRYCQTFTAVDCIKSASDWGLTPEELPSIVSEINARRASLDAQDRLCYHAHYASPAKTAFDSLVESQLKEPVVDPPRLRFVDHLFAFFLHAWPLTLLLIAGILLLPSHAISWALQEYRDIPRDKSIEYSIWLTVALWLIVVAGFFFHKWMKKTGRPYKSLLIEPIRAFRRLLRRLEKSTRP